MTPTLQRRRIGSSGLEATTLGFRGNGLGRLYAAVDDNAARDTVLAAALQFVLGHPSVVTLIPGAKWRAEAEQNARWMTPGIPPAFWADLKTAGLVRADAPTGAA